MNMGEFTSNIIVHDDEQPTTHKSDASQANLVQVHMCQPLCNNNIQATGEGAPETTEQKEEIVPSVVQDPSGANLFKFQMPQSLFTNNITDPMKITEEKELSDSNEAGFKFRFCQPLYNSNIATINEFAPSGTSTSKSEFTSNAVMPNHEPAVASLFVDLWNGHPITLPTHAWAIHKIQKNGIGPLVVINEMMANDQGVPFVLKQLVINSSGNMMAVVLNHVIDVNIISVLPLQTIEELQKALIYFDQIDCEYVYLEQTGG